MRIMWASALLLVGCSSGSGGAAPVEAGGQDVQELADAAPEARPDAPADVQNGIADTGDEPSEDAIEDVPRADAIPVGSDGAACVSSPGDGGTWCTLYAFQVDGAPLDEAGQPNGIAVVEACAPGQACTACIGGFGYAGLCE